MVNVNTAFGGGLQPMGNTKNLAKKMTATAFAAGGSKQGIGAPDMKLPSLPQSSGIQTSNPMEDAMGMNPGLNKLKAKYRKGGSRTGASESNQLISFYRNLKA